MHALKTLVAAAAASLALNACASSGGTGLQTRFSTGPLANGTQLHPFDLLRCPSCKRRDRT